MLCNTRNSVIGCTISTGNTHRIMSCCTISVTAWFTVLWLTAIPVDVSFVISIVTRSGALYRTQDTYVGFSVLCVWFLSFLICGSYIRAAFSTICHDIGVHADCSVLEDVRVRSASERHHNVPHPYLEDKVNESRVSIAQTLLLSYFELRVVNRQLRNTFLAFSI